MSFPFGNIIVDENADPNTVCLCGRLYKERLAFPELESESILGLRDGFKVKECAVIYNIGEEK